MASIERTAYPRFKRTISSRELHSAFTVTSAEVGWAVERTATEQHRLGLLVLLVLLVCYQRLVVDPVSRRSDFDRIKQPPGRATISKLRKW